MGPGGSVGTTPAHQPLRASRAHCICVWLSPLREEQTLAFESPPRSWIFIPLGDGQGNGRSLAIHQGRKEERAHAWVGHSAVILRWVRSGPRALALHWTDPGILFYQSPPSQHLVSATGVSLALFVWASSAFCEGIVRVLRATAPFASICVHLFINSKPKVLLDAWFSRCTSKAAMI